MVVVVVGRVSQTAKVETCVRGDGHPAPHIHLVARKLDSKTFFTV